MYLKVIWMEFLAIDGAIGEGGGQILRTSLTLSALLGKPVKITNIRAGRQQPGLKRQHLTAIQALAKITDADVSGATEGSQSISFCPKKIKHGEFEFDIGSAGSTMLVFQAVLPVLLSAEKESRVTLIGGTHVPFAPTFDYVKSVFLPTLGIDTELEMKRPGFYPKGGGVVEARIAPINLAGVKLRIGSNKGPAKARITSANLPDEVVRREWQTLLSAKINDVEITRIEADSPGNAILVYSGSTGSSNLGKIGYKAEDVAKDCVETFEKYCANNANVDPYLADQLLVYKYLAESDAAELNPVEKIKHYETNESIIKLFLEK